MFAEAFGERCDARNRLFAGADLQMLGPHTERYRLAALQVRTVDMGNQLFAALG